jgi:hypothetical protein
MLTPVATRVLIAVLAAFVTVQELATGMLVSVESQMAALMVETRAAGVRLTMLMTVTLMSVGAKSKLEKERAEELTVEHPSFLALASAGQYLIVWVGEIFCCSQTLCYCVCCVISLGS